MRLQVKGKNLEVSDSIRAYAERKLAKLDPQLHELTQVELELEDRLLRVHRLHHELLRLHDLGVQVGHVDSSLGGGMGATVAAASLVAVVLHLPQELFG